MREPPSGELLRVARLVKGQVEFHEFFRYRA